MVLSNRPEWWQRKQRDELTDRDPRDKPTVTKRDTKISHDGGPAFPATRSEKVVVSETDDDGRVTNYRNVQYPGMSVRDTFAMNAMQGCLVQDEWEAERIAKAAYMVADKMLAERAKFYEAAMRDFLSAESE